MRARWTTRTPCRGSRPTVQGRRSHEDQCADPHHGRHRHRARARRDCRSARLRLDQLLAHRRPRFVYHHRGSRSPRPVGHLGHGGGPDLPPLGRLAGPACYVGAVVPRGAAAGRARAGKGPAGFDTAAATPGAVVADPAVAHRGIRAELHRYFGLPFYRAMFAQAGYEADIAAYDAAADASAQRDAISDAFIEDLCAIGKPEDVAAGVARYRAAGATNPIITNITGTHLRPAPPAPVSA